MKDISDFFGDMPDRPNHPDFWRMAESVLYMDGAIEAATGSEARQHSWPLGTRREWLPLP